MNFRNVQFSQIYKPNETYFIDDLKAESDNVIRTLQRLEEAREQLENYLATISSRATEVLNIEYEYFIHFYRYQRDRVIYEVNVIEVVKGTEKKYYWNNKKMKIKENNSFFGSERTEAFKKAAELSKKYNCEIVKNF